MKSVIAAAILAVAGLSQAFAESSVLPTGPLWGDQNLSAFYRWTEALPSRPGVMLREEPMEAQPEITKAALAERILCSSTDVRWHAGIVPVSGTLYLPEAGHTIQRLIAMSFRIRGAAQSHTCGITRIVS